METRGFFELSQIGRDATVTYGTFALGGALLMCVLVSSWRLRIVSSLALGWSALLLYVSQQHSNPISGHYWSDFVAISGLCIIFALALSFWFLIPGRFGEGFRESIRRAISPNQWQSAAGLHSRELVTRWFVAVTAATTSATFYQMAEASFWRAAVNTLRPERLIYTLLLVLVPLVIVGPVEEYVLGYGAGDSGLHHEGHERVIEKMWREFSWRAFGRLLVVLAVVFQLTVFHTSFDETVGRGKLAASDLITAGFAPGLLGYYWSAALQTGERQMIDRTTWAVTITTLLFYFPGQWIGLSVHQLLTTSAGGRIAIFFDPWGPLRALSVSEVGQALTVGLLEGAGFACAFTIVAACQAWLGGVTLRLTGKRLPLAIMFGLLVPALALPPIAGSLLLLGAGADHSFFIDTARHALLTAVGASLGLALSGFPQIVTRARDRVQLQPRPYLDGAPEPSDG